MSIPIHERRHAARVATCGTLVIYAGDLALRTRVIDLSVRGIRARLSARRVAPSVGAHVRLLLQLDGTRDWHRLEGHVSRVELRAVAHEVIIELRRSQDFDDVVHTHLLAALECADTPRILLVDSDLERRSRLANAFSLLRFEVREASSTLEAIANRITTEPYPWAVVLAGDPFDARTEAWRCTLVTTFPQVPVVSVGIRGRAVTRPCLFVDCIPDLVLQVQRLIAERIVGGM